MKQRAQSLSKCNFLPVITLTGAANTRSSRTEAERSGSSGPPFLNGGCDRGCVAALATQINDGFNGGRLLAPDHVEHKCRRGSNEAFGNTCPGRHGVEPPACVDSDTGN